MMIFQYISPLFLLLSSSLLSAQVIPTQPIFDCTNPNFQVIYTACSAGDYSHCCAVGSDCCAGGCCTLESFCVGVGTPKEACCAVGDTTLCGTGPALPQPSVICEGNDGLSSYQCPPGSTCNSYDNSCYLPSSVASSASVETPLQTPSAVTVTVGAPSTDAAPSRVIVTVPSRVDTSAGIPTIGGESPSASVSVSVITVSPSPTPTASTSSAISSPTSGFISAVFATFVMSFILALVWL